MSRKPYLGPSEAQANAEALARRERTYSAASEASFTVNWDWHRREPRDLREATRMVQRAYADEVPTKLHDHDIGPDGTPRMAAKAEGYIFGNPSADDAGKDPETGQRDLMGYHYTPFRATLDRFEHGNETDKHIAAIVSHVTIGGQGPKQAAIAEGIPSWAAGFVVEPALRAFLRSMTDLRLHPPREDIAA